MEISKGKIQYKEKTYQITVKRFKDGIINDDIIDLYDYTDVLGFRFDFNSIPFNDMSVKEIRKSITEKFLYFLDNKK